MRVSLYSWVCCLFYVIISLFEHFFICCVCCCCFFLMFFFIHNIFYRLKKCCGMLLARAQFILKQVDSNQILSLFLDTSTKSTQNSVIYFNKFCKLWQIVNWARKNHVLLSVVVNLLFPVTSYRWRSFNYLGRKYNRNV